MKELIKSIIAWSAIICLVPAAAGAGAFAPSEETAEPAAAAESNAYRLPSDCLKILCGETGEIRTVTVEEYAVYAALAEIPYVLEAEALKAQVCAARTYAARRISSGVCENGAHITDDEGLYQICLTDEEAQLIYGENYASALAAVSDAAKETEGIIIMYGNSPITAAFHTSSVMTESAENVWGKEIPYLIPVPSGESSPEKSQRTFTKRELEARIWAEYPDAIPFDGMETASSPSGTALTVSLCGVSLTGERLAEILTLDSAAFSVAESDNDVTFTVSGSGHLAGMSMRGADEMAKSGSDYEDIISHFYKGTYLSVTDFGSTAANSSEYDHKYQKAP